LTLCLALAAAFLHVAKGFDYEGAIVNTLIAVALVARRHDFDGEGDPDTRAALLGRGVLYLAAIFSYGATALWVNRIAADRPFSLPFAFSETAGALAGLHPRGSGHLTGDFGEWFPLSVFFLGIAATVSLLRAWLAPWRYRLAHEAKESARARELVSRYGVDTLAPFALRSDKSYFFSEDELAFLAYRVVAGVALVSGDPVGPRESVEMLLPAFLTFSSRRGWRVAVLGAGERYLDLYRGRGLQAVYHGDEGVIDVASFSLDGRRIRKVRQSVARLGRAGYTVRVLAAGELTPGLAAELEDVAREWRGVEPQRGFTMEFESLLALDGDDALFVVGFDETGRAGGFFHLAVSRAANALSLSSMPRLPQTPNGFNEWLVVETVEWARLRGFERVSMNFSPFAALLASDAELSRAQRFQRRVLRRLKGRFQLDNLLLFNRKFCPSWERRYVVFQRVGDLPRVGLAGLAAEGYLPLGGRR
jgi:lysyl-tRNA synthetase class 2